MAKLKKNDNLLDYIPVRNPDMEWTQDEKGLVTLLRKNKGVFNHMSQRLFNKPPVTYVSMEKYGSFLWTLIDGEKTVEEIAGPFKEHFGEEVEPLYPRLGQYINLLKRNNFITIKK